MSSKHVPRTDPALVGAHLGVAWRDSVDPAWLVGWEPRRLTLDGGAAAVVVVGAGPPVVRVPPLPGSKEAWIAAARLLARRFRVVAFDLRCRFPGAPSWPAVHADFDRLLDSLAPGPLAIVGHSMG